MSLRPRVELTLDVSSTSLRAHVCCTSMLFPCRFEFTPPSLRLHSACTSHYPQLLFLFIPLRFHVEFTSISFRLHARTQTRRRENVEQFLWQMGKAKRATAVFAPFPCSHRASHTHARHETMSVLDQIGTRIGTRSGPDRGGNTYTFTMNSY